MGELLVNDKEVVVPGQVLAKGLEFLPSNGTYRVNDEVLANRLGLITIEGKVLKTIQMSGRYLPQKNDVIIGKVNDILMSGWRLDINCPYSAILPLKDASFDFIAKGADLTRYFNLEDHVMVKITNVTSQNLIDVTAKGPGLKKLRGGRIMTVNSHKVPRIIGKKGSMVSMIKKATDCKIMIGQNGLIWFEGAPEREVLVAETIKKIERESHHQGMTDKIKLFLEEKTGKKFDDLEIHDNSDESESNDFNFENSGERGFNRNYNNRNSNRESNRDNNRDSNMNTNRDSNMNNTYRSNNRNNNFNRNKNFEKPDNDEDVSVISDDEGDL